MEKLVHIKNGDGNIVHNLKGAIPDVAKKFNDDYSDVHKENILDYPVAIVSALVRMSLDKGLLSGNYDKKMKAT